MMTSLSAAVVTRLEKIAVDNGFDQQLPGDGLWLSFASTKSPLRIWLTAEGEKAFVAAFSMSNVGASLEEGVPLQTPLPASGASARRVESISELHHLVRRAFQLSRTLPDALLDTFRKATATLPRTTEIQRLVVERVGQDIFRDGLIEYWQARWAATGLAVPLLLRASHIKPWASCETDEERLDVHNGLLLSPNLDAAFDRGYITVKDDGEILVSSRLSKSARTLLGLDPALRLHGLTPSHLHYLEYHRANVFQRNELPRPTAQTPTVFQRYIGVDYSGAESPIARLDGLRVHLGTQSDEPKEELIEGKRWSRRALAEWLIRRLSDGPPTIVGIDHAFSFPVEYFDRHGLNKEWDTFLADFRSHWPTDQDNTWVRDLRNDPNSSAALRRGETSWKRLTERRAGAAKSVFQFGMQGEVATSTHAGLPWLLYIRQQLGDRVHFWPFDGWDIPANRSAIVEVYPSLWRRLFPLPEANEHQQDAYAVASWLRHTDVGALAECLKGPVADSDRERARFEGWILGVS